MRIRQRFVLSLVNEAGFWKSDLRAPWVMTVFFAAIGNLSARRLLVNSEGTLMRLANRKTGLMEARVSGFDENVFISDPCSVIASFSG